MAATPNGSVALELWQVQAEIACFRACGESVYPGLNFGRYSANGGRAESEAARHAACRVRRWSCRV